MSTALADPGVPATSRQRPLARALAVPARVDAWLEARRRLAWALTTVVLGLTAIIVVVPAATGPGGLSPLDEFWYADAVVKADRGELTNTGDKVGSYARQVMLCRGVIGIHEGSSGCGAPQPDPLVPLNGVTSADVHPPTYFFLTAGVSKVVRAVGLTDDPLIAGRLVGVLWLTLGLLVLVAVGRAWGGAWLLPVLTAVAVGASPLLRSVSAYLTPDALALVVGGGVLLAVTSWRRGRLPWYLLLPVALAPAFVKVPFILAPLFGAVLLVVAAAAGQLAWRRAVTGSAILVAGAGAGAVLWQQLRGLLAVGEAVLHPGEAAPITVAGFVNDLGFYLSKIPVSSGAPFPVPPLLGTGVQLLAWLLLAAALGGMLLRRREDPLVPVAWAGMAGMVLGSIVLSGIVVIASGGYLGGTPRYGLALLPLFAVPLMCTRHPVAVLGLLASAGVSVLAHLQLW